MADWTYSDWTSQSTVAAQLTRLRLHITEVSNKVGNERAADGYSVGSGSLSQYLTLLMAQQDRLEAKPGADGKTNVSNIRLNRRRG